MIYKTINLKQVKEDNTNFRFDAEYFKPIYFEYEKKLTKKQVKKLGSISVSIVNFGAYSLCNQINYIEDGVPFINVGDISENWIDVQNGKKIESEISKKILHKSLARENQVLLTIAGTIGNAAVAYKLPEFSNTNQAIANITIKENYSPFFISTYLNSKFGKLQTKRLTISSVQPNLLLNQVKEIKIPLLEHSFQKLIEEYYRKFYALKQYYLDTMKKAQDFLHGCIGIRTWKPEFCLSFEKSFSNCSVNNRFDAEFFQPKYDALEEKIKGYAHGWKKLKELVEISKGVEPGRKSYLNEGIPFIRVSNLTSKGIIDGNQQFLSEEKYKELQTHSASKGQILLSKDATPGIALFLDEEIGENIVSSGILKLKIKDGTICQPYYLAAMLNSMAVKMQIEKHTGGSIINHWLVDQVKETMIPLAPIEVQKEISVMDPKSWTLD